MQEFMEKSDRLHALTQQVGFAVWQLQQVEASTALYFVLMVQATKGMGRVAGDALAEKALGKTFGATLKQLEKSKLLSSQLAMRFTNLLAERNWLVHGSRADSWGAVQGDGTAPLLLQRLEAIGDEAGAVLKEIGVLSEQFATENGVSKVYIDQESERLLNQWRHADDA